MRRETGIQPDTALCRFLGICPKKPNVEAATAMVTALKSSAEAWLAAKICFADVAIPINQNSYQKDIIEGALRAQSLRYTAPIQSSGKLAVIANEPQNSELPDEQITLAIDYSRSGLNLDLFCDDISGVDSLSYHHQLGIGADNHDPAHHHWCFWNRPSKQGTDTKTRICERAGLGRSVF